MRKYAIWLLFLCCALVSGCAGSQSTPTLSSAPQSAPSEAQMLAGVVHGNFTEYSLPASVNPTAFTKGPYNTLWFGQNINNQVGSGFHIYRFSELNGTVSTFSKGSGFFVASSVLTVNALMYFIVIDQFAQGENVEFLYHATTSGAIVAGPQVGSDQQFGNLVLGPDGKVWTTLCVESCTESAAGNYVAGYSVNGSSAVSVQLPEFNANEMTPGPGGNMYVTASFTPGLPPPPPSTNDSKVFVVSTAGKIVHEFVLPHGSGPNGIATGADHNLWIAESGINKIARVTPSGAITQFTVPTANAKPDFITNGADNALWFTETGANKIGRVTTTGAFREFAIPTANSGASWITYCTTNCGTHGGLWFAETTANKIGKFISPL